MESATNNKPHSEELNKFKNLKKEYLLKYGEDFGSIKKDNDIEYHLENISKVLVKITTVLESFKDTFEKRLNIIEHKIELMDPGLPIKRGN